MIIVKIMGGLGNQMFQYAFGRSLSYGRHVPLKLDISWYSGQSKRNFCLNHFNINALIASDLEINRVRYGPNNLVGKIQSKFQRLLPYYKRRVIQQREGIFDRNILRASRNAYLSGYWASEKYFQHIAPVIRDDFKLTEALNQTNSFCHQRIQERQAISIHIRRGDYLEGNNARFFGAQPLAYYHRAIDFMVEHVNQPFFFLFSDDIDWVKKNLSIDFPCEYVSHNDLALAYYDLFLMSHCKHHIIANSTFSWWGAWLCKNPNKIIIAPRQWYNDPGVSHPDLIPPTWIQL